MNFNYQDDEYDYNSHKSNRKNKKTRKNITHDTGFENNKKRNKPKRGKKDFDSY